MITLLIYLLIAAVVVWLARLIISAMGLPHPWPTVLFVVVALIVLIWVLGQTGLLTSVRL